MCSNPRLSNPILLMGILLMLTPVLLFSAEESKDSKQFELYRLKEEIYAINLINLLELTANQIDFILARAELARPYYEVYWEAKPEIYTTQLVAFREFRMEDEADRGFSRQVEQNTQKAELLEKALNAKLTDSLNRIGRPIVEILTEAQLKIIENYKEALFPQDLGKGILGRSNDWRVCTIEETLLAAVDLSEGAYKRDREKLAGKIVNALPPHLYNGAGKKGKDSKKAKVEAAKPKTLYGLEDRKQAMERIMEAMDTLRQVPRHEVEEKIDGFIKSRVLPTKVNQMEREIRRIHQSKRPVVGPVARFLLNRDVVPYLRKLKTSRPEGDPVGVR
jgi:hypothetical protein